jgi:hypothetical protein
VHQRFERVEAVLGRHLPDRVHARVNVERRKAFSAAAEFGDRSPIW